MGTTVVLAAEIMGDKDTTPNVTLTFPAVCNLKTGLVGDLALNDSNPQDVVYESKKFLGVTATEASTTVQDSGHPYVLERCSFQGTNGEKTRSEQIAAKLLGSIKRASPDHEVSVVIIVSANFRES